jgi:SAM-dependent methyltransferase
MKTIDKLALVIDLITVKTLKNKVQALALLNEIHSELSPDPIKDDGEDTQEDAYFYRVERDTTPVAHTPQDSPQAVADFSTLMESEDWPSAVPDFLICNTNSEEEKSERGEGIIDLLDSELTLTDKKFLDFGCGEGHAAQAATTKASLSVGYDIVSTGEKEWNGKIKNKLMLTTRFVDVATSGPYDIVSAHDVLDHTKDPAKALAEIDSVCKSGSLISFRLHPWCSRHGGHQYQKINKAFAHLFLDDESDIQKVYRPLEFYNRFFEALPWETKSFEIIRQPVESFFHKNKKIAQHLRELWAANNSKFEETIPNFQMGQSFIDFVLVKK